ncbi:MAG: hypothetical protein GY716_04885, partial [bacterium]|nr:hypothetical protein [bacterium]
MRARSNRLCWIATVVVALIPALTLAAPTLNVTPTSIATTETGEVQLQVGALAGTQVILRMYADADGDGTIDADDYVVWADVIDDNATPFSPAMFEDSNAAANAVTIGARGFGVFTYPYTSGSFIWQAEDPTDSSTATFAFTITQAAQTQFVSGTVTDGVSPVPGAIVLLEPFCDRGEESRQTFSTLADETGAYTIQVPSSLNCNNRVLLSARPGYLTSFSGAPDLKFNGSSTFTENLQIAAGTHDASGTVKYQTGPKAGQGVPGLTVTIEGDGDEVALGFTDENGDYVFSLTDGDWEIESPDNRLNTRGVVGLESETAFSVSGGAVAVADITVPAANAFFEGKLYDDSNVAQAGHEVSANRSWPCGNDCYEGSGVTRADGSYTLGVYVPAGPAIEYVLQMDEPIAGLIGEQLACQNILGGQTLTGVDIEHVTPTSFITGKIFDKNRQGIENLCLESWGGGQSCTGYRAAAVTTCDGSYSLPAVDGSWNVQADIEDLDNLYRDLDETRVERQVNIAGNNPDDVNFIIGRSRISPTVTFLEPSTGYAGSRVSLWGFGFSEGGTPQVLFGSTPATIVALRPDLGLLIVEVPALAPGNHEITVVNTDLSKTSDPFCFDVKAGSPSTTCSIGGSVENPSTAAVQDALVMIYDEDDFLQRIDVTGSGGAYSVGLENAGSYLIEIVPPEGQPWAWGVYDSNCGGSADHTFAVGSPLTGQVVDDSGEGISGALIEAEQTSGGDAFANGVADEDGFFTVYVPDGAYEVYVEPPPGSRFVEDAPLTPTVSGSTDVGQVQLDRGFYFCGNVKDVDGGALPAEVEIFR